MKLILTGGGTGGHVTPALALIDEAKREKYPLSAVYICRKGGDENRPIAALHIKQYEIAVEGMTRKVSPAQIRTIQKFFKAYRECIRILKEENPDAVFATGGYVSAPVLLAAIKRKVPYFLHESNSVPGLVTKLFSSKAERVFLTEVTAGRTLRARRISTVGCPIRGEFGNIPHEKARKALKIEKNTFLITAFGGSLGAEIINKTVIGAAEILESERNIKIIHGVGRRYYEKAKVELQRNDAPNNITVLPYIDNMATVLAASDLAICRCGAVTLAELKASNTPAILIPSPNVTDDHQTENAKSLIRDGCAVLLPESALTPEILAKHILKLAQKPTLLSGMREAARATAHSHAAREIMTQIKIDLSEEKIRSSKSNLPRF